jgi:hypothetical protein
MCQSCYRAPVILFHLLTLGDITDRTTDQRSLFGLQLAKIGFDRELVPILV